MPDESHVAVNCWRKSEHPEMTGMLWTGDGPIDYTYTRYSPNSIDANHLFRQIGWSRETFGSGFRLKGIIDHIRKELREIKKKPNDLEEWVDVIILALDGAWRSGHEPQEIIDAIIEKQTKNESRTWPDWKTFSEDEAIEHVR